MVGCSVTLNTQQRIVAGEVGSRTARSRKYPATPTCGTASYPAYRRRSRTKTSKSLSASRPVSTPASNRPVAAYCNTLSAPELHGDSPVRQVTSSGDMDVNRCTRCLARVNRTLKPSMPGGAVDWTEHLFDPAARLRGTEHGRHEDHIALVTLNILEIFYEEALKCLRPTLPITFNSRMRRSEPVHF